MPAGEEWWVVKVCRLGSRRQVIAEEGIPVLISWWTGYWRCSDGRLSSMK